MSDDKARWWPEWHEYQLDSHNIPVYGVCMLFSPKRKLNPKKYILRSDSVHLTYSNYFIHGPFNHDAHANIIQPKQHVSLTRWEFVLYLCSQFSIVPPTLSTLTVCTSSIEKQKNNFLHDLSILFSALILLLVISMNLSYYLMSQDKFQEIPLNQN